MPRELFSDFDKPLQNTHHDLTKYLMGLTAVVGLTASLSAFALHNDTEARAVDQIALPTTTHQLQEQLSSTTPSSTSSSTEAITTTTNSVPTTTTTEAPQITTTAPETTLPPTTSTIKAPSLWGDAAYDPASCDQPHNSVINLVGADGKPVTAQIGLDYQIGGQKVDEAGQPLTNPLQSYSKFVYVNLDNEGITQFCFNAPLGATNFYEFYPKSVTADGTQQIVESHDHYGGAMAHRAPENVNVALPVVCANNNGETGNIIVDSFSASRLVAWSMADLDKTPSPGFGVIDSDQLHVPSVNKLDSITANQKYTLQAELFQVKDGKTNHATVIAHNVPVKPCADTHITFNFKGNTCFGQAQINQQQLAVACEATSKLG